MASSEGVAFAELCTCCYDPLIDQGWNHWLPWF
jgi:hypothetical protein